METYGNRLNQGSALGAIQDKPDGLASCLSRILNLTGQLNETNGRLSNIANQLAGSQPEAANAEKVQPMPDNALFLAKHIENNLQSILDYQRNQLSRIENALS